MKRMLLVLLFVLATVSMASAEAWILLESGKVNANCNTWTAFALGMTKNWDFLEATVEPDPDAAAGNTNAGYGLHVRLMRSSDVSDGWQTWNNDIPIWYERDQGLTLAGKTTYFTLTTTANVTLSWSTYKYYK